MVEFVEVLEINIKDINGHLKQYKTKIKLNIYMALSKIDTKIRMKTSSISGVTSPVIGPSQDHTDGSWTKTLTNQIYNNEFIYFLLPNKLYFGNNLLHMSDVSGTSKSAPFKFLSEDDLSVVLPSNSTSNIISSGLTNTFIFGNTITADTSNTSYVENINIKDKITSYNGSDDVSGKFLSGTTTGFVLNDISAIGGGDIESYFENGSNSFFDNLTQTPITVIGDWEDITTTVSWTFSSRGSAFIQDTGDTQTILATKDNTLKTITGYINIVGIGAGTDVVEMAVNINGTISTERSYRSIGGAYGNMTIIVPNVSVSNGDSFKLQIRNLGSTRNMLVRNASILISN